MNPPISDDHNFFVRTPVWVFLDSMESPLSLKSDHMILMAFGAHGIFEKNWNVVPSVLIAWLKFLGIHDMNI